VSKIDTFYQIDLSNADLVRYIIDRHVPDVVVHLASQAIVNKDTKVTLASNYLSTLNLLEACRPYGDRIKLIVSTSDKVYGENRKAKESDSWPVSQEPYQLTKISVEYLCSYFRQFIPNLVVVRFCNIYGPGDLHWNRLIPGLNRDCLLRRSRNLRSDGSPIREWVYIYDVVSALKMLIGNQNKQMEYNISSEDKRTVREVANDIVRFWNLDPAKMLQFASESPSNEINQQGLDSSRFRSEFGWSPKTSWKDGLTATALFYQSIL